MKRCPNCSGFMETKLIPNYILGTMEHNVCPKCGYDSFNDKISIDNKTYFKKGERT